MEFYGYSFACESDLQHHGIKGMHWGVRRFQNEDGSLTNAGKKRYGDTTKLSEYYTKMGEATKSAKEEFNRSSDSKKKDKKATSEINKWYDSEIADYKRLADKYSTAKLSEFSKKELKQAKELASRLKESGLMDAVLGDEGIYLARFE